MKQTVFVIAWTVCVLTIRPLALFGAEQEKPAEKAVDQTRLHDSGEFEMLLLLAKGTDTPGNTPEETEKNIREALKIYRQIVEFGATGETLRKSYWGMARCEARLGNQWEAFLAAEKSFPEKFISSEVAARIELEYQAGIELQKLGAGEITQAEKNAEKITGFEAASRIFAAIAYNDPLNRRFPQALLRQGDCLLALGKDRKATQVYERVLADCAGKDEAYSARATLSSIVFRLAREQRQPEQELERAAKLLAECEKKNYFGEELKERITFARAAEAQARAGFLLDKSRFYLRGATAAGRKSAEFYLREIIRLYPGVPAATTAEEMLGTLK